MRPSPPPPPMSLVAASDTVWAAIVDSSKSAGGRGEFRERNHLNWDGGVRGNCSAYRNASREGSGTVQYQQKNFNAQWPECQEPLVPSYSFL